jgi:proline iminopeptidase
VTAQPAGRSDASVVAVDGARLAYRIEGQGQPCLVLGLPRVFSGALRERLQLVFVDLRHSAPSDPSFRPDQISIETYADDIEQIRRALALDDVVVMGHSVHATIALEYARRYPEHVRGVVVTGAVPNTADYDAALEQLRQEASEERKELRARNQADLTPELRARLSPTEFFIREYVARGPMHWYDMTYDGTWLWEGTELNLPVLERLYDLVDPYDLAQGPGEITVPVLIAHGRYDYGAPYTLWERHRHKLPRNTFALLPRSGHTPPLEEPDSFDEQLLAWIGGLT